MVMITQLPSGRFDVQDDSGKSKLDEFGGPFCTKETAEAAQRMLNNFDTVDIQIRAINQRLRDV